MDAYRPLHCDLHDYLEIACLHGYRLHLELLDGSSVVARALTTRTAASKEEFLVLQLAEGQREVRLDQLQTMTPLDPGARFARIELTETACAL